MSPLKGHTDLVLSVGFSPDGTRIVSGSEDRTIRIWNVIDEVKFRDQIKPAISTDSVSQKSSTVSRLENGWIEGPAGELIFWVLPEWRTFLKFFPCILVIGQSRVKFDHRTSSHGTEWIKCRYS